jgi:hypothetical protein
MPMICYRKMELMVDEKHQIRTESSKSDLFQGKGFHPTSWKQEISKLSSER